MKKFSFALIPLLLVVVVVLPLFAANTLPPLYNGNTGLFFYGGSIDPICRVSSGTPLPTTATLVSDPSAPAYVFASGAWNVNISAGTPAYVVATGGSAVQVDQNNGPTNVTSPVITLSPDTPVSIGTLPTNTKGVWINAIGSDILVGNTSDLATGTVYVGVLVSSGNSLSWDGLSTTTPSIYLVANSGIAATATIVCW